MEDSFSKAYLELMEGYSDEALSGVMPTLKEDGSFVILSAIGYNNNGVAASVAPNK